MLWVGFYEYYQKCLEASTDKYDNDIWPSCKILKVVSAILSKDPPPTHTVSSLSHERGNEKALEAEGMG